MIVISQLVYEPINWLVKIIENKNKFTLKATQLCFHLNKNTNYSGDELLLIDSHVLRNPKRITVHTGDGSILYAHLLNVEFMDMINFTHVVLASSNMFWIRQGMETFVLKNDISVGLEGVTHQHLRAPVEMRKSKIYKQLSNNLSRELWSYHEGTFYPKHVVKSFMEYMYSEFSKDDFIHHVHFPEEFWLQTYVLNRLNRTFHTRSKPLCWRIPGSKVKPEQSTVNHKIIDDLGCSFYAIKRVFRNLSYSPTTRLLNLATNRCITTTKKKEQIYFSDPQHM